MRRIGTIAINSDNKYDFEGDRASRFCLGSIAFCFGVENEIIPTVVESFQIFTDTRERIQNAQWSSWPQWCGVGTNEVAPKMRSVCLAGGVFGRFRSFWSYWDWSRGHFIPMCCNSKSTFFIQFYLSQQHFVSLCQQPIIRKYISFSLCLLLIFLSLSLARLIERHAIASCAYIYYM